MKARIASLTAAVTCDLAVMLLIAAPYLLEVDWTAVLKIRAGAAVTAPFFVLWISTLISPGVKASLVFWRLKNVLPGHRAFTVYAPTDPRIDMKRLEGVVGPLPTNEGEQNSFWYRLYKAIESQAPIMSAQSNFLLFRDLAAVSALLALTIPAAFWVLGFPQETTWSCLAVLVAQYVLASFAARAAGVKFVRDVLAIHSSLTPPKKPRR